MVEATRLSPNTEQNPPPIEWPIYDEELKLKDCEETADYLSFAKATTAKDLRLLADKGLIPEEEALEKLKQLHSAIDDVVNIYVDGGMIGTVFYQKLDESVPVHNHIHVLIQTALASEWATEMYLKFVSKELVPPLDVYDNPEFTEKHWFTQVYSALFHEAGYLAKEEENEPHIFFKSVHEKRSRDFALNANSYYGLKQTVIEDQLYANIMATKMDERFVEGPLVFNSFDKPVEIKIDGEKKQRALTQADVSHIIDLWAYMNSHHYIDDIELMGREFEFTNHGAPEGELITRYRDNFIASGFLLPSKKDQPSTFGDEVKSLVSVFKDSDLLSEYLSQYEANVASLENFKTIVEARKSFDSVELESSIPAWLIYQVSEELGCIDIYKKHQQELIHREMHPDADYFDVTPMSVVRDILKDIKNSDKDWKEFVSLLIYKQLEIFGGRPVDTLQMKIAPMAWQFESEDNEGTLINADIFLDIFRQAYTKYFESTQNTDTKIDVLLTLRREDDAVLNKHLLADVYNTSVSGASKMISGIEISGDASQDNLHYHSRVLNQKGNFLKNLLEVPLQIVHQQEIVDDHNSNRADWGLFTELGEGNVSFVMPNSLVLEENEPIWQWLVDKDISMSFSIGDLQKRGFDLERVARFISEVIRYSKSKNKDPQNLIRVITQGTLVHGSQARDLHKLIEHGFDPENLEHLGVDIDADELVV